MKSVSLAGVLYLLLLGDPGQAALTETSSSATAVAAGEIGGMAQDGAGKHASLAFPTVTNSRTAKTVPSSSCTPVPTATSSFSTTDAYVYLFFSISGQANGEQLTRVWYSPDGQVAASGSWNAMTSGGGYCPWAGLQIAGSSPATKPGTWHVQVFS
ncbi:MAG: hypothetical protein HY900_14270, partial [Deltaproteobacteria bacterium]|nr:hypothetical protein [Deltaproteobacteria bacterium]